MKRKTKLLLAAAVFLGAQAAVNHCIFKRANRQSRDIDMYKWNYGRVRYVTAGEGEPLLLIHGIGAGAGLHEWERSIGALSKRYKVYALDLLGFGLSDKPPVSYSAYLYVQLISDFMRDVIKKPAYVAASANAGAYAVVCANLKPDMFKKLLLISPSGIGTSNVRVESRHVWLRRALETPIIGTTVFNIVASRCLSGWFLRKYAYYDCGAVTPELIDKYYYQSHYGGSNNRYAMAAFLSNYLNCDIERLIGQIAIPVNVIWGSGNMLNPIENYAVLAANNSSVTLTEFDCASLLPHAEMPKAFYRVCCKFFK